jgi:hypothetical protein
MAFVQLVEYTTSNPEEVQKVAEEWERATEGKRNARRIVATQRHDESGRHCDLVFFDSYEAAMENSKLPETDEYARKLRDLVDGDLVFSDLDVVDDHRLD